MSWRIVLQSLQHNLFSDRHKNQPATPRLTDISFWWFQGAVFGLKDVDGRLHVTKVLMEDNTVSRKTNALFLEQIQMSHCQNERSFTWGAKMNMKVNRSWQLLKAGTDHTGSLHSLNHYCFLSQPNKIWLLYEIYFQGNHGWANRLLYTTFMP